MNDDLNANPYVGTGRRLRRLFDSTVDAGKQYANSATGNLETAANAVTLPARTLGGAALGVEAGFTGRNNPNAGNPIRGLSIPRPFSTAPASTTLARPVDSSGMTSTIMRPVRSLPPVTAAAAPAAVAGLTSARPVPQGPSNDVRPDRRLTVPGATATFDLRPGDANTFTGGNGVTRPVPGLLNAEAAPVTPGVQRTLTAPPLLQRPQMASTPQTAAIEIPGEAERRREIAIGGALFKPASTRSGRALQQAQVEGINANFQQQRTLADGADARTLAARTQANVAGMNNQNENYRAELDQAGRTADRDTDAALRREELANRNRQVMSTLRAADGTTSLLRADGTLTPVMGADGKPFREQGELRGQLAPAEVMKAYTDQRNAVLGSESLGPRIQEQLDALDSSPLGQRYQAVLGVAPKSGPTFQDFLSDARSKGSKMTDQQLQAYFDQNFGD